MDLNSFVPVAEDIARAGLPWLGKALQDVVPFPGNLAVQAALWAVQTYLGVNPDSPTAPQDTAAAVTAASADPDHLAKLQQIEAMHKDEAASAQAQYDSELKDIEDARATEVKYIQAGSPMEWAPAIVSVIIVLGYVAACVFPVPPGAATSGMYNTIQLLIVTVVSFWLGSSKGSADKTAALVGMAKAPQIIQGANSHVSGGVSKAARK